MTNIEDFKLHYKLLHEVDLEDRIIRLYKDRYYNEPDSQLINDIIGYYMNNSDLTIEHLFTRISGMYK